MILRVILIAIAIAGVIIMGYLTKIHYAPVENAFCNLGEGLSCDVVNQSEYSEVLGIPMSIMGIVYFAAVLLVLLFKYQKDFIKKTLFVTIVFLGPSLYLSYIEFFVLENVCIFCELAKILMGAIIALSLVALRPQRVTQQFIVGAVILGVLAAVTTSFLQTKVGGPGEKYVEFAQCLTDEGFVVYGSATCVFCAKQRAMFGPAFEYIKEIECDPRNPNDEAPRCIAKDIEHTPTWIQEDENGNNIYKFEAGVQDFEALAEISGCELPE